MGQRTATQIKDDYYKIKDAVKKAKNFKELSEITGLSYSMIRTSLHTTSSYNRVKAQLYMNKKISRKTDNKRYLLDASIVGSYSFKYTLANIFSAKSKIILTDIALKALRKMGQYRDIFGNDSKFILSTLEENPDLFEIVTLQTDNASALNQIIDYCCTNKNNVILLTSNKALHLAACSGYF